jgi:hypothetical protein
MTKAALAISICEWMSIHYLFVKYFGESVGISMEEFLSRASLEDIIRLRHHTINAWLALCVLTMGRLFDR